MNPKETKRKSDLDAIDALIQEITVGTYSDDAQLRAFLMAFDDNVEWPLDGFVIGEPISVIAVSYDGNARRGLTARCQRADGSEYVVAVSDIVFRHTSAVSRYFAAYRRWLNIEPLPVPEQIAPRLKQHKATAEDIDLSKAVELIALSVSAQTARCRLLGSEKVITLRASGLYNVVPGAVITVNANKQWSFSGHPYLSGVIQSARIDVKALDLVPLLLVDRGMWNPKNEYWGEKDEPIEDWAKLIIARGVRPMFEMEQVLPGRNTEVPFNNPIIRSCEIKDAGQKDEAAEILMGVCQVDLRCLDAHCHLGNFIFDDCPREAMMHYEVGLRIGELSLQNDVAPVLPWGFIDNRPFLRCMHGYGSCLWSLGRFDEAARIFDRMLWLNPSDNQGIRFLMDDVKAQTSWAEREKR